MKTRIFDFLDGLRSSYWFVPTLMTLAAIGLAAGVTSIDEAVKYKRIAGMGWIFTGGSDGARGLLSTVASSVITVAGVVFSITIAALSLASSQFGPRLLRNFLRDRGNQIVLGTFLGTFVFCLMTLRTVRSVEEVSFVPHIGVTVSVGLALASLGAFIFFIHHISTSIQASQIVATVSDELDDTVARLFPDAVGQGVCDTDGDAVVQHECPDDARILPAKTDGYVQSLDSDTILDMARENDVTVEILRQPGDFVAANGVLARVWPEKNLTPECVKKMQRAWRTGRERTMVQDVKFGIDQLTEVASRALSPGINDPFTAITCLDRLGAALGKIAERGLPSKARYDDNGVLRILAEPPTFAGLTDAAFDAIRLYGSGSFSVMMRLLETIAAVAPHVSRDADRDVLRRHVARVLQDSEGALSNADDKARLHIRADETLRALIN